MAPSLSALWDSIIWPGLAVELPELLANRRWRRLIQFSDGLSLSDRAARRLLYDAARDVDRRGVPGDLVELGVAQGGTALVLAAACDPAARRRFWLYDSFEGLPEPTVRDGTRAAAYAGGRAGGALRSIGHCLGQREEVERNLVERLGMLYEKLVVVPGWFQETLPRQRPEQIAVLHVDGDWYESVKTSLEWLYDLVSPGGWVLDAYFAWEGCREAVQEFLAARGLAPEIQRRGYHQGHFAKPHD